MVPISGNIGSGSGTINLPVFGFNALGRLITTGIQAVDFGLFNQILARGSLLVGGLGNVSSELAPPSGPGTFVLSSTGSDPSWIPLPSGGGAGSLIGGAGISITTVADVSTIDLDLSDLDSETSLTDSDLLVFQDVSADQAKRITFGNIRNILNNGIEVVLDTSPQLGGPLDVQNFSITSSNGNGVTLTSQFINPATILNVSEAGISATGDVGTTMVFQAPTVALQAPSLTLNGLIFPTTGGAVGQVLAQGTGSQLVWSAGTSFQQTFLNTIFVGPNGSDTLGDGSFGLPYATISRALSAIPNNVPQP